MLKSNFLKIGMLALALIVGSEAAVACGSMSATSDKQSQEASPDTETAGG